MRVFYLVIVFFHANHSFFLQTKEFFFLLSLQQASDAFRVSVYCVWNSFVVAFLVVVPKREGIRKGTKEEREKRLGGTSVECDTVQRHPKAGGRLCRKYIFCS